jgi:hypothetical protein
MLSGAIELQKHPMRLRPGALLTLSLIVAAAGSLRAAINLTLNDRDIERALHIAETTEAERATFHQPYIVVLNDPAVERVEVVTEFRRYELVAEEQLRAGNWLFNKGLRVAREALAAFRGQLTIRSKLRFHPQNALNVLPVCENRVGNPPLAPISNKATPIFALQTTPDQPSVILGADVETVFEAAAIGQRIHTVTILMDEQELAHVSIDFSKLE